MFRSRKSTSIPRILLTGDTNRLEGRRCAPDWRDTTRKVSDQLTNRTLIDVFAAVDLMQSCHKLDDTQARAVSWLYESGKWTLTALQLALTL